MQVSDPTQAELSPSHEKGFYTLALNCPTGSPCAPKSHPTLPRTAPAAATDTISRLPFFALLVPLPALPKEVGQHTQCAEGAWGTLEAWRNRGSHNQGTESETRASVPAVQ